MILVTEKQGEHKQYGKGVVKGERYLGNELLVRFHDGSERWIPARELIFFSQAQIYKNAVLSFQKTHNLPSYVVRKDTLPLVDEEPQITTPQTYPSENLESTINTEIEKQTISEPSQYGEKVPEEERIEPFDLFESDFLKAEITPSIEKNEISPEKITEDNKELDAIINELLQKTREPEQEIIPKIIESKIKTLPFSSKILPLSHKKIKITEETVSSHQFTKTSFDEQTVPEKSIQEFKISKNHLLEISRPAFQVDVDADKSLTSTDIENIPTSIESISLEIPTISETPVLDIPDHSEQEIGPVLDEAPVLDNETIRILPQQTIEFTPQYSPFSSDSFDARWVIEALRLGVVPHQKVGQFSCGRETESNHIDTWLSSDMGCMILSGEYGSGKSHMLDLTAAKGIQNNWAVASIEIDPNESPFNQPKKIYRNIISSFVFQENDRLYGFREFFLKVLYSSDKQDLKKLSTHPYLGPLIKFWLKNYKQTDTFDEDLLNWIEGEEINIAGFPRMYGYQTASNIYCNILSGIGWAAHNILGLQGLLILVDEGEGIDKGFYNTYQIDKAENFIKGLILTSDSMPDLTEEIDEIKRNAASPGVKTGNLTGLRYCGQKMIVPYLWEEKSHVKIMFSFIPYIIPIVLEKIIQDDRICSRIPIIELEELNEDHLIELYDKIQRLYEVAYAFTSPNHIIDSLPKDKTRLFVKSVVEALDVMRFNPETYHEELNIQKTSADYL